jgi:hypothetical protein
LLSRRQLLARGLVAVVPVTFDIPGQTVPSDPAIAAETARAEKAEQALSDRIAKLEGGVVVPPPPPPTGIYGPGIGFDGLGNTVVKAGVDNSYRFRAGQSSALLTYRVYIIANGNTGYSNGTGGALRATIQTDDPATHFPTGVILATANDLTPGNPDKAEFHTVTFPKPATLVAGTLYHLVFVNVDAAPSTNYCSLDGIFTQNTPNPRQPKYANLDWGWIKDGPNWDEGQGYMEVSYNADRALISGANQVREAFTPVKPPTISTFGLFMIRESGTDPLIVTLENAGGTVESVSVPAASIALAANGSWVTGSFASGHTLTGAHNLRLSTASTSTYSMRSIRKGSIAYGFDPATVFSEGTAQKTSGSVWTPQGRTGQDDLPFWLK